ncbi:MAG: alpha/beta hydrolase [Candidatus Acidiferrales bacterium]
MLTLVLLPGMDGTGIFFEDFAAALPPEFKPVVVAYPDDPSLGYVELEALARAALPQSEPYLVLGESFSGPIAISIAASNRPGLLGLILCVTFARNPHPLLPLVSATLKPLPARRLPRFIQQPNLFGRFNSPYLRAKLREIRSLVSQKTLKARLEAVASIDVSEKLRRVTVPTLYLRAKYDRVVSRAACDYIRRIRPDVEVAELDAPHLLLQTVPQAAKTAIGNFVSSRIESSN